MTPLTPAPDAPALKNAYHLARFAHIAYSDRPVEDYPELPESFPLVQSFVEGDVFGLVAANAGDAVVAFRGTDEQREWWAAIDYELRPWLAGHVHGGFAEALDGVWDSLMASLYDANALEKRIWLTGHSLGGALAILATMRLEHLGFDPHALFTFGTPRVLSERSAEALKTRTWRIVNNEDIVPEIPWPGRRYAHVGERIFLTASGRIAPERHAPHLARKIDRALSIGEGTFNAGALHDHSARAYVEKLRAHAR